MKKKLLSLALALVMCLGLTVPALAAEPNITWFPREIRIEGEFHNGLVPVRYSALTIDGDQWEWGPGKYGYADKTGKLVIPAKYDLVRDFSDGIAVVGTLIEGKSHEFLYGFVNTAGQEVVPVGYVGAQDFSEGLAAIKKDGKWGFIDKTGKVVIPMEYDYAGSFSEGWANVEIDGKISYIDKTGKVVLTVDEVYGWAEGFHDGMAKVSRQYAEGQPSKYGYIDRTGKEVVPTIYDRVNDFSDGLGQVAVDVDGPNGRVGFVDTAGNVAIPLKYSSAQNFSEGLATVRDPSDELKYVIDTKGNVVIPKKYFGIGLFRNGVAQVSSSRTDLNSLIDRNGKELLPWKYYMVTHGHDVLSCSEGILGISRLGDYGMEYGVMPLPGYSAPTPAPAPAPTVAGFTDVAESSPFKDAIVWAVDQNITKGTSATTFGPSNTCTHNHILTFLWRANGSPASEGENDFAKAIAWAKEKGLAETIDGGAACTRAETMMYLWKLAGSPKTEANDTFTDVAADADYA